MLPASRLRRLVRSRLGSSVAVLLLLCLFIFTPQTQGSHPSGSEVWIRVTDKATGQGLPAFLVVQGPENMATQLNSLGIGTFRLLPGTYSMTVSLSGYGTKRDDRKVESGALNRIYFRLSRTSVQTPPPAPTPTTGDVAGRITDASTGRAIAGATVSIGSVWSGTTDADGVYRSPQLAAGAYHFTVSGTGYQSVDQSVSVTSGQTTSANFALQASVSSGQACLWSDPRTWGGSIPGASSKVVIPTPSCSTVTLDADAHAKSITVNSTGTLKASTVKDTSLTLWAGNFVVYGTADWRTLRSAAVRWTGINESGFVGGHTHMPLDTDPGVWVQDGGKLLVEGRPKLAWTRLEGSAVRGSGYIVLAEEPAGWEIGDELAIAPTLFPKVAKHYDAYDYPKVTAIVGREVTLDRPLNYDHPAVRVHPTKTMTAEVLNLTRNVVFTGEPGKRAHIIFNMTQVPQTLKYFEVRYMGPQQPDGANMEGILGRYGIHLHKMGDGARGTIVEGAVIRDVGNRGFVPHGSHGTTARNVIVHNGYKTGFWWDSSTLELKENASHDTLWDRCVASRITFIQDHRGYRLQGFVLQGGLRNSIVDSVGIGVQGSTDSSALHWGAGQSQVSPEGWGRWEARGFIAHNNKVDGWFVWQNTGQVHEIGFGAVIYHNGGFGIDHGAYKNHYIYRQIILYANGLAGIKLHAVGPIRSYNIYIDQAGLSEFAVLSDHHVAPKTHPTKFIDSEFRGYTKAALGVTFGNQDDKGDFIYLINNIYSGIEVWLGDVISVGAEIRIQYPNGQAFSLKRKDQAGEFFSAAWNASVIRIPSFSP